MSRVITCAMNNQMLDLKFFLPHVAPVKAGWVWLVGMGPGDVSLVTLLASYALTHADVVIHDHLLDERVRELAPAAQWINVGKRAGHASPKQAQIGQMLTAYAKQNKRVIRLKSGDPFIFGRGGEEIEDLVAAGIPAHVVPGVTSGVTALIAAGIPATHRGYNHAITFLTAHGPNGALSEEIDWTAMSRLPALVVYMPIQHVARLAQRLILSGRRDDTPVLMVGRASTPEQWHARLDLKSAADGAFKAPAAGPAVMAIGAFVRFADEKAYGAGLLPLHLFGP